MRFLKWEIRRIPPHEFSKDQPLVAEPDKSRNPHRAVAIAKDERRDAATYINFVDMALKKGYNAMFSDFDDSPYASRQLSRDFIEEIKTRHRLTAEGDIEVRLAVPKKMRDRKDEAVIRERLSEYFRTRAEGVRDEISARERKGWKFIFYGVVMSAVATAFIWLLGRKYLPCAIIGAWMEMCAWITAWSGAERAIMETPKDMREQKDFYDRMAKARFVFVSTEDVVKKIEKSSATPEPKQAKQLAEPAAPGAPAAEAASTAGPSSAGPSGEAPG